MRRFFRSIPVRFRIGLAVILPLVVFLAVSAYQVDNKLREVREFDRLITLVDLTAPVSSLIHELQKERGMSAGFTSSKGGKFSDTLIQQRQQSDQALAAAKAAFATVTADVERRTLSAAISEAETTLRGLPDLRARVSNLDLSVKDVADSYTNMVTRLLGIIDRLGTTSIDAKVSQAIVAYMALLRAKEAAGLERAMGSAGFAAGAFDHGVYVRFVTMIARQETYLDLFKQFAGEADQRFFADTVTGAAVDDVERMQQIALNSVHTGSTEGVQANDWFRSITAKIDLLRKVEEHQTTGLQSLTQDLRAVAASHYRGFLIGAIVVAILTIVVAVVLARSVTSPITGIVAVMRRLTEGDTSVKVVGADRGDEIGAIARALEVFRDNALAKGRLEAERHAAEARGLAERKEAVMSMANRIENETKEAVQHVQDEATRMAEVSTEMSQLTEATGSNAASVAAAADEMLRIAETVAAASEELAASSDDIRRQASAVGEMSSSAATEARRARETIAALLQSATSIGGVLDLIRDIAGKTHLLALNATIEAARAGDAGRGFGVVAAEVKMLADQTARATDQIGEQIAGMHAVSGRSSEAIEEVNRVIEQVAKIAGDVVTAVEQQREATQEISGSMHQNTHSSREVTERIGEVSNAARASSDLAEQVRAASGALYASVNGLRGTINQIVRSSSDADRRAFDRHAADCAATVRCRGVTYTGRVRDISSGGAKVLIDGDFASDAHVTLTIENEVRPLGASVIAYEGEPKCLHLKFDETWHGHVDVARGAQGDEDGCLAEAA